MRILVLLVLSLSLAGCASFSGQRGQFTTVETLQLAKQPAGFVDGVIAVGQSLGYQYTGGDKAKNIVNLSDQPNFGESVVLGRSYTVQLEVALKGRTVEIQFLALGGSSTSGAKKSEKRLREFKDALRQQWQ